MGDPNELTKTILILHTHQALIDNLFEFLHSKLVNHTYDQSINHYPY